MRRGSGINKGTDPEQSAKRVHASPGDFGEGCAQHESTQPHKRRSGQQSANPAFEGGTGVQAVQGCLGGPGGFQGRSMEGPGIVRGKNKNHEKTGKS